MEKLKIVYKTVSPKIYIISRFHCTLLTLIDVVSVISIGVDRICKIDKRRGCNYCRGEQDFIAKCIYLYFVVKYFTH